MDIQSRKIFIENHLTQTYTFIFSQNTLKIQILADYV